MWIKNSGIYDKVFQDIRQNGGDERFREFLKPTIKGCYQVSCCLVSIGHFSEQSNSKS